ncbi:hypothetical protein WJX74_002846 [Apatococcus lobatus]|uniref:Uncharacterized protein n=1 Tax=Apatococcus lobatus TaxID=904363 RepID=A0AAW1RPC0_9CHLO
MDYRLTDAYERRLRPLYDALDAGNWKAGNKAASNALAKYPGDQTVRLLQAILFQRSGKKAEALQVCTAVAEEVPTDERVLSTLAHLCRRLRKMYIIREVLEKATAADPRSVELLRGLFGAYARENKFAQQQQVASKLQRLSGPEEPYIWWIVCSLILQARAAVQGAASPMSPAQLLKLADGMIVKQKQRSDASWTYEETMLYVGVLQAQGKHQQALEHVQGCGGSALVIAAERGALEGRLMVAAGRLEAAAAHYKSLITKHADDWELLLSFLDVSLRPGQCINSSEPVLFGLKQAASQTADLKDPEDTSSFHQAAGQISKLQKAPENAAATTQRSLSLAAVELELRRSSCHESSSSASGTSTTGNIAAASCPGLSAALLQHFKQFGHLSSCATDLKCYVLGMPTSDRAKLCEEMRLALSAVPTFHEQDTAKSLNCLRKHLCFHQIQQWLGLPLFKSVQQAEEYASSLVHLYAVSQPLVADLEAKERGHADELLVLAASGLITAGKELESSGASLSKRLIQALLIVEAGQQKRHVSAPLRLAACFLSSLLAAPALATAQAGALDIKHIMHDTISGHVLLPGLVGSGSEDEAASLLDDMLRVYSDHERDAGDTLMMAYESGSWTKVVEFVAFGEQLSRSHTKALAQTELCLLDLTLHASKGPDKLASAKSEEMAVPGELPASMEFHEDLSVRPSWMPPSAAPAPMRLLEWWENSTSRPEPDLPWWIAAKSSSSSAGSSWREVSSSSLQARRTLASQLTALRTQLGNNSSQFATKQGELWRSESMEADPFAASTYTAASQKFTLLLTQCLQHTQELVSEQSSSSVDGQADGIEHSRAFAQSLHGLASTFLGLCEQVCHLLSNSKPEGQDTLLLHSHGLLAAAALARQQAVWLALVLPLWSLEHDMVTPAQQSQDSMGQSGASIRQLCSASLQKVTNRVQELLNGSSNMQTTLLQEESEHIAALWTWERAFKPNKILSSLARDQETVAENIIASCKSSLGHLRCGAD